MCFGGWIAHDTEAELPGQHCAGHACFCNGATLSPERPIDLQASELPVPAVVLPAPGNDSAIDVRARIETTSVVSAPPAAARVLPLLI